MYDETTKAEIKMWMIISVPLLFLLIYLFIIFTYAIVNFIKRIKQHEKKSVKEK